MSAMQRPEWEDVYQWQRRAAISAIVAVVGWAGLALALVLR